MEAMEVDPDPDPRLQEKTIRGVVSNTTLGNVVVLFVGK